MYICSSKPNRCRCRQLGFLTSGSSCQTAMRMVSETSFPLKVGFLKDVHLMQPIDNNKSTVWSVRVLNLMSLPLFFLSRLNLYTHCMSADQTSFTRTDDSAVVSRAAGPSSRTKHLLVDSLNLLQGSQFPPVSSLQQTERISSLKHLSNI